MKLAKIFWKVLLNKLVTIHFLRCKYVSSNIAKFELFPEHFLGAQMQTLL